MRLLLLCYFVATAGLQAQTTLPTSFDFATAPTTQPTGWSTNTTANYTTGLPDNSGGTSRAGKLQATDQHFTIHFYDNPGEVEYNLKSYGTTSFVGTVEVQESTNGTSWQTLETHGNGSFNDQWNNFTTTPAAASRYVRIILTNKVSGTNAGLDDVSITPLVSAAAEMSLAFDGNTVPNGTAVQFASGLSQPLQLDFEVTNLGTSSTLTVGTVSFSGSAAGDYSLVGAPASVAAGATQTVAVQFNPSAGGTRAATMSIANNDANENPYTVLLNGIGGSGASEPTASPTNLVATTLKTYRVAAEFSPSGADGYLVLYRKRADTEPAPVDGITYEIGEAIAGWKVAAVGSATSFKLRETAAATTLHTRIFAYNGSGSFVNYRTTDALADSLVTPFWSPVDANYYQGLEAESATLVSDLHNLINPHSVRFYSNYGPDMVGPFLARDTTNGQEVMTCVYSGNHVVYTPPFDWTSTGMNREHTLPASWMPTAGSTTTAEYQDFHHLVPALASANSQRSNHPLGNVVNVTGSTGEGLVGTDASGNTVYEPRDEQKGDAARAKFYMMVAYDGEGGGWGLNELDANGPDQSAALLLQWHLADLPSARERSRNDFVDSLQQNRNPFVDSAHLACYINFDNLSLLATPDSTCLSITKPQTPTDTTDTSTAVGAMQNTQPFLVYPNPSADMVWISAQSNLPIVITNSLGEEITEVHACNPCQVSVANWPAGIYQISQTGRPSKTLVVHSAP